MHTDYPKLFQIPIGVEDQGFPGLKLESLEEVFDCRSGGIKAFRIELCEFCHYLKSYSSVLLYDFSEFTGITA